MNTSEHAMPENRWLIWCHERAMWWRPNERGYTANRDEAGRYSIIEAIRICQSANSGGEIEESMMPSPESVAALVAAQKDS